MYFDDMTCAQATLGRWLSRAGCNRNIAAGDPAGGRDETDNRFADSGRRKPGR